MRAQGSHGRPLGGVPVGELHVAGQGAGHRELGKLLRQGGEHRPLGGLVPKVALDLLHRPPPAAHIAPQILHGAAHLPDDPPGDRVQDPVVQRGVVPGLHPAAVVLHIAVQGAGKVLQSGHHPDGQLRGQLRPADGPPLRPVPHHRPVHHNGVPPEGQLLHRPGNSVEKTPGGRHEGNPPLRRPGQGLRRPGGQSLVSQQQGAVQIAEDDINAHRRCLLTAPWLLPGLRCLFCLLYRVPPRNSTPVCPI